ncbi:AP2-like ethylene-responsive transcription factor PLT2 isoform X1 [Humulus lupulus]|uniref:AP2-like ethylene-responsive transcription factor PLT2 isoform X1 n=1 Tax=Humulus lupulus TaxID=3486 RepID=UPI002B402C86|nr:AP2-like ethylene-responsive transcription factor PLT2 isoform X1 [Humulus lupulus]
MGSMNTNNWLSFPLSPTHPSLPSHQFTLGLVNDDMDNPFQNQASEWNLINGHGSSSSNDQVPKVADFLGVSTKSENQTDLMPFNEIHHHHHHQHHQAADSDYLFANNSIVPVDLLQQSVNVDGSSSSYDFQENPSNLQSLTLSMGSGSKGSSACETSSDNVSTNSTTAIEPAAAAAAAAGAAAAAPRRTLDTFGQRTSIYRGVTRHRWTGRYEAHLWDNSCRREGQSRKGRQVYLGGYDKEEKAARAYDLAALKYWGTSTTTNFPISNYEKELEDMKHMTRQEFVASIRRKSSGFSRGASMYRGVTRHHQHGRWQARIGRVAGNKDLYLGTFSTEEEAAEAYDIAAIKFRGLNAVTNFDMNRYDVKSILESNTLPIGGGAAKRLKEAQALESSRKRDEMIALSSTFAHYGAAGAGAGAASGSTSSPSSTINNRLQAYPLLQPQTTSLIDHMTPHLTLQNHETSPYHHHHQDPNNSLLHQNYIQTQLQLHQQQPGTTSYQFYSNGYNNNSSSSSHHPAFLQGFMDNMGTTSSVMDNGGTSSGGGSYGGYCLDNITANNPNNNNNNTAAAAATATGSGSAEELALVKVDYDMPSGGYGGWSGSGSGSGNGSNPGIFTMWNDL